MFQAEHWRCEFIHHAFHEIIPHPGGSAWNLRLLLRGLDGAHPDGAGEEPRRQPAAGNLRTDQGRHGLGKLPLSTNYG